MVVKWHNPCDLRGKYLVPLLVADVLSCASTNPERYTLVIAVAVERPSCCYTTYEGEGTYNIEPKHASCEAVLQQYSNGVRTCSRGP